MENSNDPLRPEPHGRKAEYDDPHFHDEDLEIGSPEDAERRPIRPSVKKKPSRHRPPHRYYED